MSHLRILLLIGLLSGFYAGSQTIQTCMHLKDSVFGKYRGSDMEIEETVVDLKNQYYEARSGNYGLGELGYMVLVQAKLFSNKDQTKLLVVTHYDADEQCYRYVTNFYEISNGGTVIKKLKSDSVIPALSWELFVNAEVVSEIFNRYLPEIRSSYLGENGSLQDVYQEVYDYWIFPVLSENKLTVTLTVCDYIPRNHVGIKEEDWNLVSTNFTNRILVYSVKKKRFEIKE